MSMSRFSKEYGLYLTITIVAIVIACAAVLPRRLTQPTFYSSTTQVTVDRVRYAELFDAQGVPDQDMQNILIQTRTLLKQRNKMFATVELQDTITWNNQVGTIRLRGTNPTEVVRISDEYATEFVRHVQAAGGREILRNILGWETVRSLRGEDAGDELTTMVRDMVRLGVFTFNRPIEPVSSY
ncbi:MAG: hypothetical protein FJ040_12055, partial [Chloroflexi bacterium]|nr:hypothetical protein [Chloroflexota bacterium]